MAEGFIGPRLRPRLLGKVLYSPAEAELARIRSGGASWWEFVKTMKRAREEGMSYERSTCSWDDPVV